MFSLGLKQVRSFRAPKPARIAPLTILVGENSSGKSSFLALARIALELAHGNVSPSFNRDPFFLGAYDQVAHYHGGRGGRSPSFEISVSTEMPNPEPTQSNVPLRNVRIEAEFAKRGSQPGITRLSISYDDYALHLRFPEKKSIEVDLRLPSWSGKIPSDATEYIQRLGSELMNFHYLPLMVWQGLKAPRRDPTKALFDELKIPERELNAFGRAWMGAAGHLPPLAYAFAPVRTKPERTYNPIEEAASAEGIHVPMVLAKTYFTDKERWERLRTSLNRFGRASGLFQEIRLKTLGRSDSDPFQILLKIIGPYSNLIDVGYGISQVLPILVDMLNADEPATYLLQQPEVHLHPRAQAELATFVGQLVKETGSGIIMETHSDFILDRLRSDVRNRVHLGPEDISILFLERTRRDTTIHEIPLDENGNLTKIPRNYRKFFMEEEQRILGI